MLCHWLILHNCVLYHYDSHSEWAKPCPVPLVATSLEERGLRLRLVATSVHITYYVPASHKNQVAHYNSKTIMYMYSIRG